MYSQEAEEHNSQVYDELSWYLIDVEIKTRMIGYWGEIVTGKHNKYGYIICT